MALLEFVKGLTFIVQLLQTMSTEVELSITVYVDNVGEIWYQTTGQPVIEQSLMISELLLRRSIKMIGKSSLNL